MQKYHRERHGWRVPRAKPLPASAATRLVLVIDARGQERFLKVPMRPPKIRH